MKQKLPLRVKFYLVMFLVSAALFLVTGRWLFFAAALGYEATMIVAAWRHEHGLTEPR